MISSLKALGMGTPVLHASSTMIADGQLTQGLDRSIGMSYGRITR